MTWRLAGSLIKLRDQINTAYPNRSKLSDGTIGDAAHSKEVSDHNPNADGVVCAFDITHDPEHGVDIDKLSDALANSRDSRIKYLIANRLILVPDDYGWTWQPYEGVDPHTSHLHVSVYGDYDNTNDWDIGGTMKVALAQWRVDAYSILGRNGLFGTKNALNGDYDQEWRDRWSKVDLDQRYYDTLFQSDEAKNNRHNIEVVIPDALRIRDSAVGDADKKVKALQQLIVQANNILKG